jgi:uncharacterized membrane protein YbhN (UPF0104 family)
VLEIAVTLGFLGFLGWAVAGRWSEVRDVIGELSAEALAVAALAAFAAVWCSFLSWRALLADFGSVVPVTGAMRIFFVGQLSKYLPGKLWPILTQSRLGREYRVPARASAAAALLVLLISLGAGLLLTACTLPLLGAGAFARYWWALLALPLAAVALWPPVLNWALDRAMRLARRDPMPRPLSLAGIGRAVAWSLASWLLYGVHLWALLAALGANGSDLLVRSVGAFAGSWVIGFLLLVAPAGVGPREVALVALLASTVSQPVALVAAAASRLVMTVADLLWPAVALLMERRRERRLAGVAVAVPAAGEPGRSPNGVG